MRQQLKLSIGIFALILIALTMWAWYFATRPSDDAIRTQVRPPLPATGRSAPANGRTATAKERAAAIHSIVAQLEAFKADRYEIATRYQSKALKQNFSSVENFRRVIKQSYPQFARYKDAKFGTARSSSDGRQVEVEINLTGADGIKVQALYHMALEDGTYRVAGVTGGIAPQQTPQEQPTPEPDLPPGVRKIAALPTPNSAL